LFPEYFFPGGDAVSLLVRKEARLLLPSWGVALVVATVPLWLQPWQSFDNLWMIFFGAAVLALALSPFGQETAYGTFGLLLVQPEKRISLWRTKTTLLVTALATVWIVFVVCGSYRLEHVDWIELVKLSALVMLLAFSGGLWSALLLRDMVSAFFCTCLAPVILWGATIALVSRWKASDSQLIDTISYRVLIAYGLAGYLWARRLFLAAEDTAWTGGQVSLRSGTGWSLRWLAFGFGRKQSRWTALAQKELQLHEITMLLVPVLVVLHVAGLALNRFGPVSIRSEMFKTAIPLTWLAVVPLVIGCVAVAEERRLNTLEGLHCLPVSKRASFGVKFVVTLALGIVLDGLIPCFLLNLGGKHELDLSVAIGAAAAITAVAFYASTMSRSLLQAIPTTLGIPAVLWAIWLVFTSLWGTRAMGFPFIQDRVTLARGVFDNAFGSAPVVNFLVLALPLVAVTLLWLLFDNYKSPKVSPRIWLGNLLRILAALAGAAVLATVIYDRSWEYFMPREPHHGPARLSGRGRAEVGMGWSSGFYALLPDGRLWIGRHFPPRKEISGGFVRGSNWIQIAGGADTSPVALRADGTLWNIRGVSEMRQIGSDSDWTKLEGENGIFLAVKKDGTLWRWGNGSALRNGPALRIFRGLSETPRAVSASSWPNVFVRNHLPWQGAFLSDLLHHYKMDGTNWSSVVLMGQFALGIRTDGSLWAAGTLPSWIFGQEVRHDYQEEAVRVGSKSDWVELGGDSSNTSCTALESDGTLWTLDYGQSKRPSRYNDWLAASC
jgi:hypothetical protein